MPKAAEREIAARGGAVRWRSKCRDGKLWRFAVVRRAGSKGGRVVAYDSGRPCK